MGPNLGADTISHLGGDELQPSTLSVLLLLQEAPHLGVVLSQSLLSRPLSRAAHTPGAQTSGGPEEQEGLCPKQHFQRSSIRLVAENKKSAFPNREVTTECQKYTERGEDLLAAQSRAAERLNQTLMSITNAMSQPLLEVFALLQKLLVQT